MGKIISIECARKAAEGPTPPEPNASAKTGKRFVLNQHTRRRFLALVLGPMGYRLAKAAKASGHSLHDGEEQIVRLARKQADRERAMGRAA